MTPTEKQTRKPLRLPFENRKRNGDWGDWIYRHRIGLLSSVIVILVCTIAFLSYRIVINKEAGTDLIALEFEKDETPEKELTPQQVIEKLQQIQQMEAMGKAQNKISNENSKFNSSLGDAKKTNADDIYKEVDRVGRELAAGRQNYEKSLKELEKNKNQPTQRNHQPENTSNAQAGRERVQGNVFVSYELGDRNDVYLHIPAYKCQYGGAVVVAITVDRTGKVVSANVDQATQTPDDCIVRMALQSAKASVFSASSTAPDKHKGTITYRFVDQ